MARSALRFVALLAACALFQGTAQARGWVEKTVTSDAVTVDVERDGTAVVAHEILLGIRGGPLQEFSISPVDGDAQVQEDATATLARSGAAAGFPIPLAATVDGTRLALKVQSGKGLHSGTYLLRFRYKTSLADAGKVHPTDSGTLVEWSGPSFADGIDSARVVFRFPQAPTLPRTPSQGTEPANVADDPSGVFLSNVHRGTGKDELELVRPHVSKAEIVAWKALVDGTTFDPLSGPRDPAPVTVPPPQLSAAPKARPVARSESAWLVLAVLSLAYGALVVQKARWVAAACSERRAIPRPLVPLPIAVRALLSCAALFGAGACVVETLPPFLAAACLLLALGAATHLPSHLIPPLRGPGEWVDVGANALDVRPAKRRGRVLDVATPIGFAAFVMSLGVFVVFAVMALKHSPYHGVAIGLASAVLFPLFCTGRSTELPLPPAVAPVELIDWLLSDLAKSGDMKLSVLGRMPRGGAEPDELRLLVMPAKPLSGLKAIEVGLDVHDGPLGPFCLPFVIVRTLDGSPAADSLPKGLYVTRGRSVDERVVVLRPKVPTERMVGRLVRDVSRRLTAPSSGSKPRAHAPKSASISEGSGSLALKPGTTSSPAHAT